MPKFYTIGYGILEGTHKQRRTVFQHRLCRLNTQIGGQGLSIVDIRKHECGSRNGQFFRQGIYGMGSLINGTWPVATYNELSALYNPFGSTQAGLRQYATDFRKIKGAEYSFGILLKWIRSEGRAIILLCGCHDALKSNGTSWHCHRVPLALELLDDLPEGWGVEHL